MKPCHRVRVSFTDGGLAGREAKLTGVKELALGFGRKTNAGAFGLILDPLKVDLAELEVAAAAPAGAVLFSLPAAEAPLAASAAFLARLGLKGGISAMRVDFPPEAKRGAEA